MPATERELWLLNLYRNSELHGALLMARLARSVGDPAIVLGATRHCATEAEHAALLTELILRLGGRVDPLADTIQQHYSEEGGAPSQLVDLLVLSEVLEARVLLSYGEHLARPDVHPLVRNALEAIMRDEQEHSGREAWVEQALAAMPADRVARAREKWSSVDARVAAALHARLEGRFAAVGEKP